MYLANVCNGAYKKIKFVYKRISLFVKITVYSPIEKLDVSLEHCNRVYLEFFGKILTAFYPSYLKYCTKIYQVNG
jgi:hypothetical protein